MKFEQSQVVECPGIKDKVQLVGNAGLHFDQLIAVNLFVDNFFVDSFDLERVDLVHFGCYQH